MAKRHLELASPFACWVLVNDLQFNDIIWGFHDKYSRTCPNVISDTDYSHFAIYNSQKISMDLRETYKQHIKDIESTFPPMDDFQEIQI